MVIGILAILKAGGTCVPLDPAYVSGRLKDILNDADSMIVHKTGCASPGQTALSSMRVFDPNMQLCQPASNPQVPQDILGSCLYHLNLRIDQQAQRSDDRALQCDKLCRSPHRDQP